MFKTMGMIGIDDNIELLKREFESDDMKSQIRAFLERAEYSPKWMLYSDYYLDDRNIICGWR